MWTGHATKLAPAWAGRVVAGIGISGEPGSVQNVEPDLFHLSENLPLLPSLGTRMTSR